MRLLLALVATATVSGIAAVHSRGDSSAPPSAPTHERVVPNDNRDPAGTLHGRVLTLQLEARLADWHPDGDSAPGAAVPAFAEVGRAPRIPGPLIRVRAGTIVEMTVRNRLESPLEMHGLVDRIALAVPPRDSAVMVAPGATQSVRFELDAPGTYYYWGTSTGRPLGLRTKEDAQLSGAIVVDPLEGRADDRILVIGMWTDTEARAYTERKRLLAVVNGRSWPNAERMRYTVGDTVRWRVINASSDAHPMHLHGFYFRVDARGDLLTDTVYLGSTAQRVFTEVGRVGGTFDMTWVPERPGNWLFHCHIAEHFARRGPLGMALLANTTAGHALMNHATDGMGGLVTGVTVLPRRSMVASAAPAVDESRRHLRLLVRRNVGGSDASPYFEFTLQDDAASPAPPDSGLRFGPPLVLVRGEPVRITVVNQLREPTAVHWHGIELESYFDGVPDFSGEGRRLAPAIAPGDSFEARFTPPRSGTFIYHTHFNEERQLLAGLAGALVVLEPGERYDPSTDHVVMLASPTRFADQRRAVLVGDVANAPLILRAGVRHRLRVINMTLRRPVLRVDLMRDSLPVAWSLIAKDAVTLPRPMESPGVARRTVGLGETLDFELTPEAPGDLRLDVRNGGMLPPHTLFGSIGVHVVP
jgi:FtsP/CotA-like multicopper oxidase with cupredoxin domain